MPLGPAIEPFERGSAPSPRTSATSVSNAGDPATLAISASRAPRRACASPPASSRPRTSFRRMSRCVAPSHPRTCAGPWTPTSALSAGWRSRVQETC